MSGNLVCSMPQCQTTAGCVCRFNRDWGLWASLQTSKPYREGLKVARRSDNPYPAGTWEHDQWNAGYDSHVPLGG